MPSPTTKGPLPSPVKESGEAGREPGGSTLSLPHVGSDLSMRSGAACVIVVVIVMIAWPGFANAVSVYVNAAALLGWSPWDAAWLHSGVSPDINP